MGIAPKLPEFDAPIKLHKPMTDPNPDRFRKPCQTHGDINRCDGMTCHADDQCASQCCGQLSSDGTKTCHALIEDSFCPRAVAPKIDYRKFRSDPFDDLPRRNDLLSTIPLQRSNEMPTYRGQDGCKVHGVTDQCDGQACGSDADCHSGCCGHFVSFSLKRCLPLTDDNLCARFLEPSFTSPIPSHLPAIQSTIEDMYGI